MELNGMYFFTFNHLYSFYLPSNLNGMGRNLHIIYFSNHQITNISLIIQRPLHIQKQTFKMHNSHGTLYTYKGHMSYFKKTNHIQVFGSTNHMKILTMPIN